MMQHISEIIPGVLIDAYLGMLEAREAEQLIGEGREVPDLLPYQGSEEAELLKRVERLACMGCSPANLEFAIAQFCRFFPARYEDVARLVFGERGMLNVR